MTGPDLSPLPPQTSADDPAYAHGLDDLICYASPPSRIGGVDDDEYDEDDEGKRNLRN